MDQHTRYVTSIAFSSDGKYIASGSGDKNVKLWNFESLELITTFSGHSRCINSVVFSPNCRLLASASADSTIKLWNMVAEEATLKGHTH